MSALPIGREGGGTPRRGVGREKEAGQGGGASRDKKHVCGRGTASGEETELEADRSGEETELEADASGEETELEADGWRAAN